MSSRMAVLLSLLLYLFSNFKLAITISLPPRSILYTLPDIDPPPLEVVVNDLDVTDVGLIFLTPIDSRADGLYIYRSNGELVWAHTPRPSDPWGPANLHTVEYDGQVQLAATLLPYRAKPSHCVTENDVPPEIASISPNGTNVVYNNRYEISKTFNPPIGRLLGAHEFYTLDNGTLVVQQHGADRALGRPWPDIDWTAHVFDSATGDTIFEWRALDFIAHEPPCRMFDGKLNVHTNSIDRAEDGNWIINNLGMCCAVKVKAIDGTIIWRFGGVNTDFKMTDDTVFYHMHHVRVRSLDEIHLPPSVQRERLSPETHTVISFFDNAWNLETPATSPSSSAVVVLLDLQNMTGQVVERYWHPTGKHNPIFGSFQILPNGHRFIGWGQSGEISEYDGNGNLVYYAGLGLRGEPMMSYRAYKGPWFGLPVIAPDVLSFSWSCVTPTVVHVSWNGATDVAAYKVSTAIDKAGPFDESTTADKDGFETVIWLDHFAPYVIVEPLGPDGGVLGRSAVTRVKVPHVFHREHCMRDGCSRWSPGWGQDNGTEVCLQALGSHSLLRDQSQ